ncbi:MAG TPA: phospholipase D-like domain-containing protein [Tepidisphaeraceae bacterium]|jgi:cardiolipin synthase|nr:phospholipase D-like domain-containing protein [Tepidisphaeraceae bacterium]
MEFWLFDILALLAIAIVGFLLVLILFEPGLRYRISPPRISIDSPEFLRLLGALCDAEVRACDPVEVLADGPNFYAAEIAAISKASKTIHLESYIFKRGRVAQEFIEALSERSRNGVRVKLVVDAIGSLFTPDAYFKPLRDAGGSVAWYQPLRWKTFKRWNNRTHRKLLIIDGRVAFAGGADIGDDWLYCQDGNPYWRDTVFCFKGNLVSGLQSTFAENWLESSGEILADDDYFPLSRVKEPSPEEQSSGIVVNSTPSAARGTRAHILYQTLLACAGASIHITTPYFLPDRSTLAEIVKAVHERGVKVIVLTPGKHADHLFTRASSRRRYGELLKAGAEIYEYQPSMIHVKTMVVDGIWSVVGSTNFDNRSFGLNDEVNLAIRDRDMAARLEDDFHRDLQNSARITYDHWMNRSLKERLLEPFFQIFDRQF